MKTIIAVLTRWLFIFMLVGVNVAFAQDLAGLSDSPAPDDWTSWNILGLNALVLIRFLGEVYSTLKNGGGLVGIGRTIFYGQNVPKAIAVDYHQELKAGAPAVVVPKDIDQSQPPKES